MDFKRKAYDFLLEWKNREGHKPIIIEGLRQVGKSYLAKKFAEENYNNYVILDFRHNKKIRECFGLNLTVNEIISSLSLYYPPNSFVPNETVLIFEEINDCPNARTSLKSFSIDGRYEIIATGSLLGVQNYRHKNKVPIPTGYEEYLTMSTMDFEEFLWANNTPVNAIDELKKYFKEKNNISKAYQDYFYEMKKRYAIVGGLPEVVNTFISSNNNYNAARSNQLRLIKDYRSDFGRFINEKGEEEIDYILQAKLNLIFDSIPRQLSRENENYKFKLTEVKNNGRLSEFYDAIDWLMKAGLVLKVCNTKAIEKPLSLNADENSFKLFFADSGILMALLDVADSIAFLNDNLDSRKGAMIENMSAIEIFKAGFGLFYFSDTLKHLEIDFLVETLDGITLIEEKSTNGKMAASRNVMEGKTQYKASKCIRMIDYGFGQGEFYFSIPHYLRNFYLDYEMKLLIDSFGCSKKINLENETN